MKITGTGVRDFGLYELRKTFSNGALVAAILANLAGYQSGTLNAWQSALVGVAVLMVRGLQLWATDNTKQKL